MPSRYSNSRIVSDAIISGTLKSKNLRKISDVIPGFPLKAASDIGFPRGSGSPVV